MTVHDDIYIDGAWRAASGDGTIEVVKPADETVIAVVPAGSAEDVEAAVRAARAALPAFNLVTGTGETAGHALATHEDVDLLSFTGSTSVGRRIAADAGAVLKRVALELGGKSANVILSGADLATVVKAGVANVMTNSGQTWRVWTRMLVHADDQEEAVTLAVAAAGRYAPGDPFADGVRMGPVAAPGNATASPTSAAASPKEPGSSPAVPMPPRGDRWLATSYGPPSSPTYTPA